MRRSVLKITCLVSGILFAVLSGLFIASAVRAFERLQTASIGIIGGADGPTALFLLQKVAATPVVSAAIVTFLIFAGTGLFLIFSRKPKE